MGNRYIVDRQLPERAKLTFFFPNVEEGPDYSMVTLPFFENPKIRERKRARYQKYSLISRSSNLYSYLGADSRKLAVTFKITLPHLLEEHPDITVDKYINSVTFYSDSVKKESFMSPSHSSDSTPLLAFSYLNTFFRNNLKDTAQQVLNSDWGRYGITPGELDSFKSLYAIGIEKEYNESFEAGVDAMAKMVDVPFNPFGSQMSQAITTITPETAKITALDKLNSEVLPDNLKKKYAIIDTIIYWINIIRSSVVNNAISPVYGPPIIRLSHGLMYQNVPCICTDYALDWEELAGYDLQTLLPRRLNVTLNLEEFRTGDFGEFHQNDPIKRDNLAGWEAVLGGPRTMDPGYTTIAAGASPPLLALPQSSGDYLGMHR